MKLSEAKSKGIFRKTIYIGEFFDGVKDKDVWIKLREPTTQEANQLKENASLDEIGKVVQSCIEDHNFEGEEGGKATSQEVYEFIASSSSIFTKVLQDWQDSLPLLKQSARQ